MPPHFLGCALLSHSHPVFDLGESLLDRVQIWRVWRQEPETRSGSLDGIAHGLGFVRAKIVHDNDIAGLERGDELLVHIGAKAFAVDRAIEDARRG